MRSRCEPRQWRILQKGLKGAHLGQPLVDHYRSQVGNACWCGLLTGGGRRVRALASQKNVQARHEIPIAPTVQVLEHFLPGSLPLRLPVSQQRCKVVALALRQGLQIGARFFEQDIEIAHRAEGSPRRGASLCQDAGRALCPNRGQRCPTLLASAASPRASCAGIRNPPRGACPLRS